MIAATSCGLNTKIGMSGWPETMPSASDSARSSTGYLAERVRNGGASVCGLSPSVPIAWQRAQFFFDEGLALVGHVLLGRLSRESKPDEGEASAKERLIGSIASHFAAPFPGQFAPSDLIFSARAGAELRQEIPEK